jgi:hypothetical protein
MCYLVRQQQAEAERGGTTPPSLERLRPRLIGAVAAALIGGLAVAALVVPSSTPPVLSAQDSTGPAPLASNTAATPSAGFVQHGSAPVDDGVPTASDVVKVGAGNCHHGL